ncbi:hypothetical protein C8D95_101214 [Silicimonas algicola]|uniref:Peptidase MA superfamily protein n=1 Tax=Silicimonas algicola TaxID=1826607 RepID=A0A316GBU6_9RHOB|nr:hypothetical protein C8D95_101214 [Silicimonas algicola]
MAEGRPRRRRFRRSGAFVAFLVNAAFATAILSVPFPGLHRALYPEAFGLSEIAPRVWTDAPDRAEELLGMAEAARANVVSFFGDDPPRPTLILCATRACADDFGVGGNGLAVADVIVAVSPGGLTRGTLTHEMMHARLHRRLGLAAILRQPYPTWFDEGLATHVSGQPAWRGTVTDEARDRVRQVTRFWRWRDAMNELGVGPAYGAAAAEVAAIEALAGREGLLELIRRAEAGDDFDRLLRDITG